MLKLLAPLMLATLVAAGLTVPAPVAAQDDNGGLVGLTLPIGSRALGQGRAISAARGELHAVPYNPASQSGLEVGAITYSRFESADVAEINSNYVAGAYVAPWGTIGGHFVYHDLGELVITDTSPTPIGTSDLSETVVGVTYAHRWRDKLDYGATLKWYQSDLGVVDASGPAFDLGVVYAPRPGVPIRLSAALRNLGPDLDFEDGDVTIPGGGAAGDDRSEQLPTRVRFGIGVGLDEALDLPDGFSASFLFDIESDARDLAQSSQHFGGNVTLNQVVTVRGGVVVVDNPFVDSGDGSRQIGGAFGIGIVYEGFEADVSREVSVSELGDETHFSVGWRF